MDILALGTGPKLNLKNVQKVSWTLIFWTFYVRSISNICSEGWKIK